MHIACIAQYQICDLDLYFSDSSDHQKKPETVATGLGTVSFKLTTNSGFLSKNKLESKLMNATKYLT